MQVYHFIGEEYGVKAVGLRRLKISRVDQLNDPFELMAGTQTDQFSRLAMRVLRDAWAKRMGILCFSRDWHNTVMWGHYANRHRGLCLGFELDDRCAMPVRYVRHRLPADRLIYPDTSSEDSLNIARQLVNTKFSHWRYEREVRAWASLDPDGPPVQFKYFAADMKLTHVYIGARSSIRRQMIADALGDDLADVKIVSTRLAFRSFRVVTQRNPALWDRLPERWE
mgnify:FL=1|jgi:hypothetical protein